MSLEILRKYKIRAKKALGQNFLVNDDIVEEISHIVEVNGKNIVEVGPGYGALTEKLVIQKPKELSLVELDKEMIEILENRIKEGDFDIKGINFNINNIDILRFEPDFVDYSVIANIPYYITSPILRHFLYGIKNKPKNMVILMQKDVGDKIISGQIVGKKGKVKNSVISLFVSKKAYVDEVLIVSKDNFVPAPKVESSVLLFEIHDKYKSIDDEIFLDTIKKGFREPRKMLIRNLVNSGYDKNCIIQAFKSLGIVEKSRGEDLDIATWCSLILKINN